MQDVNNYNTPIISNFEVFIFEPYIIHVHQINARFVQTKMQEVYFIYLLASNEKFCYRMKRAYATYARLQLYSIMYEMRRTKKYIYEMRDSCGAADNACHEPMGS